MSEFAQSNLGVAMNTSSKRFNEKNNLALYKVWIDVSSRMLTPGPKGYLFNYCEHNATFCRKFVKEINKQLGILLTRFALLHR